MVVVVVVHATKPSRGHRGKIFSPEQVSQTVSKTNQTNIFGELIALYTEGIESTFSIDKTLLLSVYCRSNFGTK